MNGNLHGEIVKSDLRRLNYELFVVQVGSRDCIEGEYKALEYTKEEKVERTAREKGLDGYNILVSIIHL